MPGIFLTTNIFAHVGGLFFSAFFREKESLAKKANCRAAPLSRLDRCFFGKKLGKTPVEEVSLGFFFLVLFPI